MLFIIDPTMGKQLLQFFVSGWGDIGADQSQPAEIGQAAKLIDPFVSDCIPTEVQFLEAGELQQVVQSVICRSCGVEVEGGELSHSGEVFELCFANLARGEIQIPKIGEPGEMLQP